jgi:ParB family transcriptional regulator, chromosome partitioning protein
MQDSSAFQYLTIDTIHESTTNPRRTFDQDKLYELAASIKQHGLIQPITVRPNEDGFEIVAGARRYRAAQLAELFSIPARIVQIDDAQAIEWQLVENSQRVDVHPYEEAQGFQRLLDIPGYDVAAIAEKSGKSASHIYARLSLLQLIPEVAEAFTQERITASHASLIARLPHESQSRAYGQCWRKDWQDKEAHLLPSKYLSTWIQANLYLNLTDAPFDREDSTLNSTAGACIHCPRRSGYNTSLFADVQGDQCLDAPCYQLKIAAHIERELAAHPDLIQIETSWRNPNEQRPRALTKNDYRELPTPTHPENLEAEPVRSCDAERTAIIVYGRGVGTTRLICIDEDCPVHTNKRPSLHTEPSATTIATEEEAQAADEEQQQEQQSHGLNREQEKRAEQRRQEFERKQREYEAERERKAELLKTRYAAFDRVLENAPATFTAVQLRVFLRALVTTDPYSFGDDVAAFFAGDEDYSNERAPEEVLLSTIDGLADEKLTGFALRMVLTAHTDNPEEGDFDFLVEAESAFPPPQTERTAPVKKRRARGANKAHAKPKSAAKKKTAA